MMVTVIVCYISAACLHVRFAALNTFDTTVMMATYVIAVVVSFYWMAKL